MSERYKAECVSGKRSREEQEVAIEGAASEATIKILDLFRGRGAGVEEHESDPRRSRSASLRAPKPRYPPTRPCQW